MIGVEITGVEGLQADLKKYGVEAEKAIDKAVRDTTFAIETDAKRRLTGMYGSDKHTIHGGAGLLGSIYKNAVKIMEGVVGTAKHYAAYIEFGIGDLVFTSKSFTDEEKAVAAQFRGKKRVKGFKGDSFLGWAATNQSPKLIERIEKNLNAIK